MPWYYWIFWPVLFPILLAFATAGAGGPALWDIAFSPGTLVVFAAAGSVAPALVGAVQTRSRPRVRDWAFMTVVTAGATYVGTYAVLFFLCFGGGCF
jgi:hypothetical protein